MARPATPQAQLALLSAVAPAGDDWVHEIKYDGFRILAERTSSGTRLWTRNGKDWTGRYPAVAAAADRLPATRFVLDGEVVIVAADGRTSFQALQNTDSSRGELAYYVFDLLELDGRDLRRLPLLERKARLRALLGARPPAPIRYSDHAVGNGSDVFAQACRHELEGIISKRADAPYVSGRGGSWLKVKCVRDQEFVIGGFTDPGGSRLGFGALLVGTYEADGRLHYRGKVGTGFNDALLRQLRRRLEAMEVDAPPFLNPPRGAEARAAHWVRPELVAQVHFTDMTEDGKLRHPSFQGLREDKPAHAVTLEAPAEETRMTKAQKAGAKKATAKNATAKKATAKKVTAKKATAKKATAKKATARKATARKATARKATAKKATAERATAKKAAARKEPGRPSRRSHAPSPAVEPSRGAKAATRKAPAKKATTSRGKEVLSVAGVRLTSPAKVLYPEQGVTKLDLARYYELVAERMTPHIAGRPLTLVRCPAGHTGECFFQKHIEHVPEGVRKIRVPEKDGVEWYGALDGVEGMIGLVQLGVLELHTWNSRDDRLEHPDRFIIDLDPDEGMEWGRVKEAALHVRAVLEELGLVSFLKTTGGKGLHVVVPLVRRSTWDEVRDFSRGIAVLMARVAPDRYTIDVAKKKRKNRILVDYLRNARGATAVEVYSTRARPGAPVSAPIAWDELEDGVRGDSFTVANLPARLQRLKQNPWKDFGAVKQSLTAPMKRRLGV